MPACPWSMVRTWALLLTLATAAAVDQAAVASRLAAMSQAHPRLFMDQQAGTALKARLASEPLLAALHRAALAEADQMLGSEPIQRVQIGRRLLDKSRTCLARLTHLSYAWRMTSDAKYLERAKAEMLAVAAFSDWNPSHFLDVAEMTAAMAIGYDWLHAGLDDATRTTVRTAIMDKGIRPSLGKHGWINGTNNWNQVCNAGMVLGVLAIHDADPTQSAAIIARAVDGVPHAMRECAPDGAYPEGASYWCYGTTFNVLLIAALESALGTDFALGGIQGFLPTADYYLHVTGTSGQYFNYADCGGKGSASLQPAMFWFAARRQEPYLLWSECDKLIRQQAAADGQPVRSGDRLFPLILAWAPPLTAPPAPPTALSWTGNGPNPVGMHRSAWSADATFVGLKGGSPGVSHAHMDVGAFVVDAEGLRWADDLGMQNYNALETQKVDLWNRNQDSQRWRVFGIGPFSHNVLTVDGQLQVVKGQAPIVKHATGCTVVDTSGVYQGQFARAQRGAALLADRTVLIQDEVTADQAATVRWAMLTRAEVTVAGPGRATLAQQGKTMIFRVLEPADAELRIWSTDPPAAYDAPQPGTRLLGFEVRVPAGAERRLAVHLSPGREAAPPPLRPLTAW